MTVWRRIKAALKMGALWGVGWFAAGMVLLVVGLMFGVTADVPFPIGFGAMGFVGGTAFSAVLGMAEGRRRFEEMSMLRFAGWGAAGGLLLTGLFVTATALAGEMGPIRNISVLLPVFGVAGAASATGILALARAAEDPDALEGDNDLDRLGSGVED